MELVEQPAPRGEDSALDGLPGLLPLAADESCTDRHSLLDLVGRYQYVNIKLDKCGGLTEALAMCAEATRLSLDRHPPIRYESGLMHMPDPALWG